MVERQDRTRLDPEAKSAAIRLTLSTFSSLAAACFPQAWPACSHLRQARTDTASIPRCDAISINAIRTETLSMYTETFLGMTLIATTARGGLRQDQEGCASSARVATSQRSLAWCLWEVAMAEPSSTFWQRSFGIDTLLLPTVVSNTRALPSTEF